MELSLFIDFYSIEKKDPNLKLQLQQREIGYIEEDKITKLYIDSSILEKYPMILDDFEKYKVSKYKEDKIKKENEDKNNSFVTYGELMEIIHN